VEGEEVKDGMDVIAVVVTEKVVERLTGAESENF
jgi:hypothetical protein